MSADDKSRPTREECEAVIAEYDGVVPERINFSDLPRLARAYISLLDSHEQTIQQQVEWNLAKAYVATRDPAELLEEQRSIIRELQADKERLAFYFNARGESRPRELLDLELRCVSDGCDSVSLDEWITAIDKGINAARGVQLAKEGTE